MMGSIHSRCRGITGSESTEKPQGSEKSQAPTSKLQRSSRHKAPKRIGRFDERSSRHDEALIGSDRDLDLGVSLELGCWCLEFSTRSQFFPVLPQDTNHRH